MGIRNEEKRDYQRTEQLVKEAFAELPYSDQTEHELVHRLRKTDVFIPELSIVYEREEDLIGHIMLSKIQIKNETKTTEALALAPVSVKPAFQNQGVGKALMHHSLEKARMLGFQVVIVIGHERYYPKFGFTRASQYQIFPPFDVSDEAFMVLELVKGSLDGVHGIVEYPEVFLV
ncbi:N-acetyltransferase [Bacillaceae bacterium SIJ1]|uniref:GNAT family N-acetyltransferase n=1 Tax=Litoribacterium kuwaitense TaxID=1398745 RepID=UPI0013EA7C67|nr:N-acetyltransferase [Litoribacterium kuwaitense]NGP45948.1 N-acetyltransferase [Litoribacterium kuwaitense]